MSKLRKLRRKLRRINRRGRRNNNQRKAKRTFKTYSYVIRTAIVNYITPEYTEQNLNFQVYQLLRSTDTFKQLASQYQQYKLDRVTFVGIPRTVGGTDPAPIWIYFDVEGETSEFNYLAIQEIQGSRSLPVKHASFTRFSQSGRQNDFHYWYDIDQRADCSIRLHSEAPPNNSKFWQFQLEYMVTFRGFTVPETQESKQVVRTIGEIKRSGAGNADGKEVKVAVPLDPDELNDINNISVNTI